MSSGAEIRDCEAPAMEPEMKGIKVEEKWGVRNCSEVCEVGLGELAREGREERRGEGRTV